MRSMLIERKPDARHASMMASVCSTVWMRLTARCTRGSKSCTPRLARLKPRRPRCSTSVAVANLGSSSIEERRDQRGLADQPLDVGTADGHIARDEAIATAVEAGTRAEGDMNIKRERLRRKGRVAASRVLAILRLPEVRAELRDSRIGGIARPCDVVSVQQVGAGSRLPSRVCGS